MELILIRHFPTTGNLERRYIGRTDEPLAKRPMTEKAYPPAEVIIASPLKRCIETASLIYPGREPVICEAFRECNFGVFEGKNYEELKHHPQYQEWLDSKGSIAFPGGEQPDQFKARCIRGFTDMAVMLFHQKTDAAAMIVHGGTIMAILERFDPAGREFYRWQVGNGEGYVVRLNREQWMSGEREFVEIRKL